MKKLLSIFLLVTIASCSTPKKNLIGYWYKPKTTINIRFHPDKTFEFTDYDSVANKSQKFTGTYKLNRPVVTLLFSDKTTQTLSFDKLKIGKGYYLKKDDYYLIKDERVNNAVPPDSTSVRK